MKLLFENWRNYQKEVVLEQDRNLDLLRRTVIPRRGPSGARLGTGMTGAMASGATEIAKMVSNKRFMTKAAKQAALMLVGMYDFTGITGYPGLKQAYGDFSRTQNASNAGLFLLAVLGSLPMIGGWSRMGAKGAKSTRKVLNMTNRAKRIVKRFGKSKKARCRLREQQLDESRFEFCPISGQILDKAFEPLERAAAKAGPARKTQKMAWAGAKIKGLNPAFSPKTGKPYGVFVDQRGNAYVMVVTEEGPVTFMYSSGTSMLVVNKAGDVVGAPRIWYPVKGKRPEDDHIIKFSKNDPRFGGGDKELASRMLYHDPKFDAYMRKNFGFDWPQKAREPEGHFIRRVIKKAQKEGVFNDPGLPVGGKYPDPSSYFGQLGKKIEQISADGKVSKELVDYFGPVVKGDSAAYNEWRKGLGLGVGSY